MADPSGITARLLSIVRASYPRYSEILQLASRQQYKLIARNYGPFLAFVVARYLPETARQYESIHYDILRGSKEEAMSFRQAVTDECSMTAVAVSHTSRTA